MRGVRTHSLNLFMQFGISSYTWVEIKVMEAKLDFSMDDGHRSNNVMICVRI